MDNSKYFNFTATTGIVAETANCFDYEQLHHHRLWMNQHRHKPLRLFHRRLLSAPSSSGSYPRQLYTSSTPYNVAAQYIGCIDRLNFNNDREAIDLSKLCNYAMSLSTTTMDKNWWTSLLQWIYLRQVNGFIFFWLVDLFLRVNGFISFSHGFILYGYYWIPRHDIILARCTSGLVDSSSVRIHLIWLYQPDALPGWWIYLQRLQ